MSDYSRLYFDIESSVNLNLIENYGLKMYNNYLNPDTILKDWNIYCISYTWLDDPKKRVYNICVDPSAPDDDEHVVKEFYKVLEQADMICGHNIKKFDLKMFKTRAIFHKLPPLPEFKIFDTLTSARKTFRFTSNKLSYLAQFLGVAEKGKSPDWRLVRSGDVREIKRMVKYCDQDVKTGVAIHDELAPWDKSYPNRNELVGEARQGCPNCGGTHFQQRGQRNGYYRLQCQGCFKWLKEPCADLKYVVKYKNET
jgi:DNA polymerase elongation subunit (family B)